MLRATIIVLLPVLFMASAAFAQSPNLDSLEQSLFKAKTVEEKVRLRLEIGEHSKSESEALRNFETAKKMAIGQSNALNASVHSAIAVFYSRNGDLELAISEKLKEVVIWRSANVRTELADALFGLAKIQRDAYNLDDALRTNREAGDLYGSLENYSKQIECLNRLGIIHKNLQNYAQALPLYHEAYNLSVKYGLEGKKSSTCINIGVILKNQENYDGALEQYYIAEEISLDSKNYGNLASIYNNIGNVLRLKKDFDKALKYYQLALDNRKKSGKKRDLGYTYNNMSIVYKEQGDLNQAARYLKKAEKAKIEVKDYESIAATYLNFAELYLESQSNANFEKYASLAEKYATQFEQAEILREVRINYGKFEANNGNYKEAYYYLEHVFDELDTLDEGSQKILTSVLQAHFKDEQNQSLIRTLSKTNAQLDKRTKELEEKEETSKMLIAALGFGTLILIVLTLLWFFK
ncbi:MAG: tetratricopeptide (TPR) repeat protein, partial [Crocinitomicaceae bacterium]